MDRSVPAVSIVMTVFNGGRFLASAARSVVAQTWKDWEMVILDNGSTDGSFQALEMDLRDERVRFIRREKNLGIAAGTNAAFAETRGRYVGVLDQDDMMLPEKLARQVAFLEEHRALSGVGARTEKIGEDDRSLGGEFTLHTKGEHRSFTQFSQAGIFGSYLFRRDTFERFPRRDAFPFSSDYDFVARVGDGGELEALPEVLFRYRIHANQTTARRRLDQIAAECAIRVLTARRRAGAEENFASVVAVAENALRECRTAKEIYRRFIELKTQGPLFGSTDVSTREKREDAAALLGVYHARKLVRHASGARDVLFALKKVREFRRDASWDQRRLLRDLFFFGPIRALDLKPWRR
ncbi:MAG TPA: glycosyltransferase [Opitutaceae bacterium]|nr:glycosyltransferase [Opitutaceae bacterium]